MYDGIHSMQDMERLIQSYGFPPFFQNGIPGFSVEEHTPKELWYNGAKDGRDDWPVWDWKGPVANSGACMYGKLFQKKAGFVSLDWLPDFLNARREGMDFRDRDAEGLVYYKDRAVYDAVRTYGPILTPHLKFECNYRKGGSTGFETVITRLMMQTYLCISDFVYRVDRAGRGYGWGVALYTTPESLFGEALIEQAYACTPEESRERIYDHLSALLPQASEQQILKMIE